MSGIKISNHVMLLDIIYNSFIPSSLIPSSQPSFIPEVVMSDHFYTENALSSTNLVTVEQFWVKVGLQLAVEVAHLQKEQALKLAFVLNLHHDVCLDNFCKVSSW